MKNKSIPARARCRMSTYRPKWIAFSEPAVNTEPSKGSKPPPQPPFDPFDGAQLDTGTKNEGADLPPELALAEQRLAPGGPGWSPWQTAELGAVVLVRDGQVDVPEPYSDLVRYSRAELVRLYADGVTGSDLERVHLVKTIFGGRVIASEDEKC